MSNRGQAQYLRIFSGSTTYQRWQGFYVGQTITLESQQWQYYPFVANGLIGGGAGNDEGVTITVPATATAVQLFEEALNNNYLVEVRVFEFDTRLTQAQPQTTQQLIGAFIGEVLEISGSFSNIAIALGSGLAPVGAQAPPRKYTSELIGAPLRP
jgi:hypothetical protein